MRVGSFVILLTSIGIFESCNKDEATPDFAAESVGTYSYNANILRNNGPENILGTLSISRDGGTTIIVIDEIEEIKYSRLDIVADGYGFDMESATITDDNGNFVSRRGSGVFAVGSRGYHGRYYTKSKQLVFRALYDYPHPLSQFSFSADVKATQK